MQRREWLWGVCLTLGVLGPGCAELTSKSGVEEAGEEQAAVFHGDPENGAVFAVDVSVWEGILSQYEMDCFWSAGVRHLIAGTQQPEVTRQQLAMAVSRGLSVDGYVFLHWRPDIAQQVAKALATVEGFPIGRMWLDAESDPDGTQPNLELLQQALDACRASSPVPCGIYTGPGFWKSYFGDTPRLADAPLWYAHYNGVRTLSAWPRERFGGWERPAAKQFAEEVLCNVGVDQNVMQVVRSPQVVVDRAVPPAPTSVPGPPEHPYPVDGSRVGTWPYVTLMTGLVPHAVEYELALESWNGQAWVPYTQWRSPRGFMKTYPYWNDRLYRHRARARNAHGWGSWASWSTFEVGHFKGTPPPPAQGPDGGTPPPPPVDAGVSEPPRPGVPSGLAPDGLTLGGSSVKMSCAPLNGATRYEFLLEYEAAAGYLNYSSWVGAEPSRTVWPQLRPKSYRFKVRAELDGAFRDWSGWATFRLE